MRKWLRARDSTSTSGLDRHQHAEIVVVVDRRHDHWLDLGIELEENMRGVFGVGDVADVVQRFDGPVAADVAGQIGGTGLPRGYLLLTRQPVVLV